MIQFNLLPDVKKEYIKTKQQKRLIMTVSTTMIIVSVCVVLLMFSFVQLAQKKNIDDLTKDIETEIASIQSINDLDKILTIQNQLNSLPELHQSKPEASRLFTYLIQTTPVEVKIGEVNLDLVNNTMEIVGTGDSLASVNKYVDTLKFVEYQISGSDSKAKPFSQVITDLSRSESRASYTINLVFDPTIFDNTLDVAFIVPTQITTRSVTGKPSLDSDNSLFEEVDNNQEGAQ